MSDSIVFIEIFIVEIGLQHNNHVQHMLIYRTSACRNIIILNINIECRLRHHYATHTAYKNFTLLAEQLFQALAPRLEATDVVGIAFTVRFPTLPVIFILLTPVNIYKTITPNNFCSILEPGSYY